jgi:hypothetical protein
MTPAQTAQVAALTLQGVPGCKIAQAMGVHESTVSRAKAQVRPYIESEMSTLMMRGLKPARRTLCRLAAEGNKATDKDILSLSLKASQTILQHANGQPGTIINTLIQINQTPEQSTELSSIADFLSTRWDKQVIDVQSLDVHDIQTSAIVPDGTGITTTHTQPAGDTDQAGQPTAIEMSAPMVKVDSQ